MGRQVNIGTLGDHLKLGLITGNILVTIFAVCGNIVAVVVAYKSRWTSTPTKVCLISLSLSDLLLTLTSTPVDLDQLMDSLHSWHLGQFLCKYLPFLHFMFLLVNSFSLLAMLVQRYWSTSILLACRVYNRAENPSKIIAFIIFTIIWLIPFGFSVPYMDGYTLNHFNCTTNITELRPSPTLETASTDTMYEDMMESTPYQSELEDSVDIGIHSKSDHIIRCYLHDDSDLQSNIIHHDGNWYYFWRLFQNRTDTEGAEVEANPVLFRKLSICQQTREAHVALYHAATGVIFLVAIIGYFRGYHYFRVMKKLEGNFEKSLVPVPDVSPAPTTTVPTAMSVTTESTRIITAAQVRNVQLMSEIRKMLARQRKGIKLVQRLTVMFVVGRMPIWIYTILDETEKYNRSGTMLGIYYSIHLLASVKGAVTPFLYAHASQSVGAIRSKFSTAEDNGDDKLNFGGGSKRSRGSDLSNYTDISTITTIDGQNQSQDQTQIIINQCIASNINQSRSAMKMTQPIQFLNYFRCGCFVRRKNSSTYIFDDT